MTVPGEDLEPPDDLDLRRWLSLVRRRWLAIAITAVLFVAISVGFSARQDPVYRASAQVLVRFQSLETLLDSAPSATARDAERALENELVLARSTAVANAAADELGYEPTVTVRGASDADVLTLTASSATAEQAAADANTYAAAFLSVRDEQDTADLLAARAEVEEKLAAVDQVLADLERQLTETDALLAITPEPDRDPLQDQRDALAASLEDERTTTAGQRAFYQEELDRLELAAGLSAQTGARLVEEASPPPSPASPRTTRDAGLALLAGLLAGIAVAVVRDRLDDSIRTAEDLKIASGGLPLLSTIPAVPGWRKDDDPCLVTLESPNSAAAEAYRKLRTDVLFLTLGEPVRELVVTSAKPGEGKTTTVANLAMSFARAGKRVIVAACDLRRPRLHLFLGAHNDVGFTSVLLGDVELADALQAVPNEPNLVLLSSGPQAPNPSELLGSPPAQEMLGLLSAQCDLLIIDSPPILPVTDALVLARQADTTLVVCRSGITRRGELKRAVDQLHQVNASVAGIVLNGVEGEPHGYRYRYGTTYGYGEVSTESPGARRRRLRRAATEPDLTGQRR